jgi:cystathionine beta-lyase
VTDRRFSIELADLRQRTGAKWTRYGPDVLPAWVAEMDFPPAPFVARAIDDAVRRGDLGYPPFQAASRIPDAFAERAEALWGWSLDPSLVHVLPNVMTGLHHAIRAFTDAGDGVVVTTPIYHPFLSVVPHAGRRLVEVPLLDAGQLDLDGVAGALEAGARMVLLCHPHNPTGHVVSIEELDGLAALVVDHDAWLVSDEVHAELTQAPHVHRPVASRSPAIAARTITVTSASKAFNIPGLRCALAVSGTASTHERLGTDADMTLHVVGTLGIAATLAAWTAEGDEWLAACREVLRSNRDHLARRLRDELPAVGFRPPDATFLAWLDFRGLGLGDDPGKWLLHHARVALSPGYEFGTPGNGFARLNFATAPAVLDAVLDRIVGACTAR